MRTNLAVVAICFLLSITIAASVVICYHGKRRSGSGSRCDTDPEKGDLARERALYYRDMPPVATLGDLKPLDWVISVVLLAIAVYLIWGVQAPFDGEGCCG